MTHEETNNDEKTYELEEEKSILATHDYIQLLETMVEQQKMHIQSQDARILEQEQTIAELRALVDELRLLKAGMEETLEEFKRQLSGTKSGKTKTPPASAGDEPENPLAKTTVKEHTRTKKTSTVSGLMLHRIYLTAPCQFKKIFAHSRDFLTFFIVWFCSLNKKMSHTLYTCFIFIL